MVLRPDEQSTEEFHIRIDGKWIRVTRELLAVHPGGSAISTYRGLDATTVFHTFHVGSKSAYKLLCDTLREQESKSLTSPISSPLNSDSHSADANNNIDGDESIDGAGANMGRWDLDEAESNRIINEFDALRLEVRQKGMLNGETSFFARKLCEALLIIATSLLLQSQGYFVLSALCMGLAWQQLGWMIHEYCHHQHFKNHLANDMMSYLVGNLMQGFSSAGWKEQHNAHHAATNVIGRDGDIDLMPLWATVPSDLEREESRSWIGRYLLPYQHLYWAIGLPLLRLSWLAQSIVFVTNMDSSFFEVLFQHIHRKRARVEQITLLIHWLLVIAQYFYLPDNSTRLVYFAVSQLFGGFLIAHVVTYNHYSTDKFHHNARIMGNYCCLQLHTTRNMRSGLFIDWLWGGLNYQIEHHLFPTMPRNHLKKVAPMVRDFCRRNNLPYMIDDYTTGWRHEIEQFRRIARLAAELLQSSKQS